MATHYPRPKKKGKHTREEGVWNFAICHSPPSTPPKRYCMNDNHVSLMRDPFTANPSCASSGGGGRSVTP